jgi:hypothetical protein
MIDRYHHFRGYADTAEQPLLEYAVGTVWRCPPMPTHAECREERFLTCPKPDLAVGFCRQELFQNCDWNSFPETTQKLICYEGVWPHDRAFYFLTIEMTGRGNGVDDPIALNRCLNNASQALHNMYEFFKEADREIEEGIKIFAEQKTEDIEVQVATVSTINKRPMPLGFYSQSQPVSS